MFIRVIRVIRGQISFTEKSQDQHAIAVTIKAITFVGRFRVSAQHKLPAGERAHEHEQGRTREMKIREQNIDMLESIRRINKKIGRSVLRDEFSIFASRRLQNAYRRRAYGDDSLRVVDLGCRIDGNGK